MVDLPDIEHPVKVGEIDISPNVSLDYYGNLVAVVDKDDQSLTVHDMRSSAFRWQEFLIQITSVLNL